MGTRRMVYLLHHAGSSTHGGGLGGSISCCWGFARLDEGGGEMGIGTKMLSLKGLGSLNMIF